MDYCVFLNIHDKITKIKRLNITTFNEVIISI